jgi:hypothetical protein
MKKYNNLKYLKIILKHKYYVFLAGLEIGCPLWRLIIHDMSKFLPSEFSAYREYFYPTEKYANIDSKIEKDFAYAWLKHQNRNDHHWSYWIQRDSIRKGSSYGNPFDEEEPLEMTTSAILEMVADWLGFYRTYNGSWPKNSWPWLKDNYREIKIHQITRIKIEELLISFGVNLCDIL